MKAIRWRKLWPVGLLAVALGLFFALGLHRYASFDVIRDNHVALTQWTRAHHWMALLAFFLAATAIVAMGFPTVTVIVFAGGLMFGLWEGAIVSNLAGTVGGLIFFLAVRHAREAIAATRFGPMLERLQKRVHGNGFLYLLTLRLMPFMPTVVTTMAAAAAHVRTRDFIAATFLGPIPMTLVFSGLGAGAAAVISHGGTQDIAATVMQPIVILPVLGLAALSLAAAWLRERAAKAE